jgi:hypothetical protein
LRFRAPPSLRGAKRRGNPEGHRPKKEPDCVVAALPAMTRRAARQWNFDKKIKSFDFALQENLRCHANKTVAGGIWYT